MLKYIDTSKKEDLRNYIADLAIEGAKLGSCGKMCNTCAFKRDSPANLEHHNVTAAYESLVHGQFNCHVEIGLDSGQPCNGFKAALQILDPERKLKSYRPKNLFNCLYCDKLHGDDGRYWKRCDKNKSGYTKFVCDCGGKHLLFYDFKNDIELFKK